MSRPFAFSPTLLMFAVVWIFCGSNVFNRLAGDRTDRIIDAYIYIIEIQANGIIPGITADNYIGWIV
jgi:hypothetical protein